MSLKLSLLFLEANNEKNFPKQKCYQFHPFVSSSLPDRALKADLVVSHLCACSAAKVFQK
jgi:hypothetical protein